MTLFEPSMKCHLHRLGNLPWRNHTAQRSASPEGLALGNARETSSITTLASPGNRFSYRSAGNLCALTKKEKATGGIPESVGQRTAPPRMPMAPIACSVSQHRPGYQQSAI